MPYFVRDSGHDSPDDRSSHQGLSKGLSTAFKAPCLKHPHDLGVLNVIPQHSLWLPCVPSSRETTPSITFHSNPLWWFPWPKYLSSQVMMLSLGQVSPMYLSCGITALLTYRGRDILWNFLQHLCSKAHLSSLVTVQWSMVHVCMLLQERCTISLLLLWFWFYTVGCSCFVCFTCSLVSYSGTAFELSR